MARSLWNGTLSLGALHVPIALNSATDVKTVRFHEVHLKDEARIEHRRFCSKENKEVPFEEVVKGYEVRKGEYVAVEKEEIDAAAGDGGKIIDIEDVVDGDDIDAIFYDKAYYLGVRDGGEDAYRLLHDALEQTGRVAIGRFTFHNREYLAAVRPRDGVLTLQTMRFADELVPKKELTFKQPSKKPAKREIEMAGRLVENLHEPFKPSKYKDEHRKAVERLIERKRKGEKIDAPVREEREEPDDLMAALEASLGSNRKGS